MTATIAASTIWDRISRAAGRIGWDADLAVPDLQFDGTRWHTDTCKLQPRTSNERVPIGELHPENTHNCLHVSYTRAATLISDGDQGPHNPDMLVVQISDELHRFSRHLERSTGGEDDYLAASLWWVRNRLEYLWETIDLRLSYTSLTIPADAVEHVRALTGDLRPDSDAAARQREQLLAPTTTRDGDLSLMIAEMPFRDEDQTIPSRGLAGLAVLDGRQAVRDYRTVYVPVCAMHAADVAAQLTQIGPMRLIGLWPTATLADARLAIEMIVSATFPTVTEAVAATQALRTRYH